MISSVIETHAAVMPRKCTRATILTADSLRLIDPAFDPNLIDIRPGVGCTSSQSGAYEREIVLKPLSNWDKFAICYRNSRSQRKEYGK
jgi:hypothetical protein